MEHDLCNTDICFSSAAMNLSSCAAAGIDIAVFGLLRDHMTDVAARQV